MSDSGKKIRELSCKTLYSGFAGVEEYRFLLPQNNTVVSRTVITRPSAAAILLINKSEKTIILIRQFRASVYHNTKDGMVWEVPAGVIEINEKPQETIIRETLEETGFRISDPKLISAFYPTVGLLNEVIYLYYDFVETTDKIKIGGGNDQENEFLDVVEMTYSEALHLLDSGQVIDGKTIIALLWLKNAILGKTL